MSANTRSPDDHGAFPTVAIGASAGGLEAFIALFSALPADTGMAFILIPHLAPTHASSLADIIYMPDMDGYQVARQLRRRPDLGHPVIVAVTGFGRHADRQLAHDAGFDEHATKPLDPKVLARLLKRSPEAETL